MRFWVCKECGHPVEIQYNHVGACSASSAREDCGGTFEHPNHATCRKAFRDLFHDEVRQTTFP
jgi:hypothetical protein